MTIPSPVGGTKHSRPKTIAAVVFRPSFELPGPGPAGIQISKAVNSSAYEHQNLNILDKQGDLPQKKKKRKKKELLLTINKIAS